MDLRQIELIIKIAEEGSITEAAEKLFISQPALNQQLLNLEKSLGTPLFQRGGRKLKLTEAGEIYVEAGRKILKIKSDTYAKIADVAKIKKEEISVGITPGKGGEILAYIYKRFYTEYPEVRFIVYKEDSTQLQRRIQSGTLDMAILTIGGRDSQNESDKIKFEELCTVEMLLAMSKNNLMVHKAFKEKSGLLVQDLRKFNNEYFAIGKRDGTNGKVIQQIFENAGFAPKIYYSGDEIALRMAMVEMNLCCTMIEEHHQKNISPAVCCFPLSTHPCLKWAVAYRQKKYMSSAIRAFISMAKEYWIEYKSK